MVTATYNFYYGLAGIDLSGATFTLPFIAANPVSTTMSDTQDAGDDGVLAIGDNVEWSAITNAPVSLFAVTAEGYPILENETSGFKFLVTPVNGLHNQTFTMNKTDPYAFCFAAGTGIATPQGERRVEDLKMGDLVTTACGRAVPVLWLGQQTFHKTFMGRRGQMVRIRAGAFGDGVPHTDLDVTADHGLVLDGLVIHASALVNGDSIRWVPLADLPDSYIVYHIETEAHDVILANGAASETFVDAVGRAGFDNYAEYLALYGAERIVPEMPAPRATSARMVPGDIADRLNIARQSRRRFRAA